MPRRERVRWLSLAEGTPLGDLVRTLNQRLRRLEALATGTVLRVNGGADMERTRVNLIAGTNVTITASDDAADDEIDVTIAATGGSGSPGPQGAAGPALFFLAQDGLDGADGAPGPQGTAGATGPMGPQGAALFVLAQDGADGEPGPPGRDGANGANGATGAQGPAGPALFFLANDGEPGEMGPPGPGGGGTSGPVDAGTLVGATLASNVLASSLTSVGTLSSLDVSGTTILGTDPGGSDLLRVGGSLTLSGAVSAGTTAATAGNLRVPNAGSVQFRNAANSGNVAALQMDNGDNTFVRGTASVFLQVGSSLAFRVGPNEVRASYGTDATSILQIGQGGAAPTAARATRLYFDTPSSVGYPGEAFTRLARAGTSVWDIGLLDPPSGVSLANTDYVWRTVSGGTRVMALTTAGQLRIAGGALLGGTLALPAGTTTLAPLQFTAGTSLTAPAAGAVEWDGTNLYVTQTSGPTRKTIAYTDSVVAGTPGPALFFLANDGEQGDNGPPGPAGAAGAPGGSSITRVSGASGAAGADITYQHLTSDAATNNTTTYATVMTTTGVGSGTWRFSYLVVYRSAATTTGVKFRVNHTGTVPRTVMTARYQTTGGTAATAAADQVTTTTAQMLEGWSSRALNADLGPTLSVDTANADMMMVIEGTIVVTVSGSLVLDHASEVAAASTVQSGTHLRLEKIA